MLVGKGCSFIHIPKCGGTAIRQHMDGHELGHKMPLGSSCPIRSDWHRLPKKRPRGRIFTIVRHPASWLRSYWLDQSPERIKAHRFLHRFWSDDLEEFIRNVCEGRPGYVSALFSAYLPFHSIKVFKLESGLHRALKWAGIERTWIPAVNASPPGPLLSAEAMQMVAVSEAEALAKFGYGP